MMRRAFDVMCAALVLVVLSPLFFLIAVAIKLDDGGPVFYAQSRVGMRLRVFRFYKFRSMVPNADRGRLLTAPNDARLTQVGRFLRRYKLDELPQFINVLKGDMQLVGARPEVERYVEMFRVQYARLLRDRPGITDPATLAYRQEEKILVSSRLEEQYVSQVLPDKLRLSLDYQQQRNFLSDLGVILRTVLPLRTPRPNAGDMPKRETSHTQSSD